MRIKLVIFIFRSVFSGSIEPPSLRIELFIHWVHLWYCAEGANVQGKACVPWQMSKSFTASPPAANSNPGATCHFPISLLPASGEFIYSFALFPTTTSLFLFVFILLLIHFLCIKLSLGRLNCLWGRFNPFTQEIYALIRVGKKVQL